MDKNKNKPWIIMRIWDDEYEYPQIRCPYCGADSFHHRMQFTKFCPYCGHEIGPIPDGVPAPDWTNDEAVKYYAEQEKKYYIGM